MKNICSWQIIDHNGIPTVILNGEINGDCAETFEELFKKCFEKKISPIILDYTDVNYINSAGMAILFSFAVKSAERQCKLYFSGLTSHFKKIAKMISLTEYVIMIDTLKDFEKNID